MRAKPSKTQRRVERIGEEAKRAFEENHGSVGYRKVQKQLVAEGTDCCEETVRKTLTKQGLHATVAHRRPTSDLLFHSDRGSQYAADIFRDRLDFLNVTQSMSRKGNCWDNARRGKFLRQAKDRMVQP